MQGSGQRNAEVVAFATRAGFIYVSKDGGAYAKYGHGGPIQVVALDPAGKSAWAVSRRVVDAVSANRDEDFAARG